MKSTLTAICTIVSIAMFAQTTPPNIAWQKCLGGRREDYAYSIQQTTDSGYIVAGASASKNDQIIDNHGGNDYGVVKLKKNGIIQWRKSLGGSGDDYATSIQQTTDGGYIAAGDSYSNDGDVSGNHGLDYWIVKLDTIGNIQWQKCLGGSGIDVANSIQQTTDGGYIVAGYSNSNDGDVSGNHGGYYDYWIVKLKKHGEIQWQKCLGGSGIDVANSIQQTTDGGYIVAGYSNSNDGDVSGNHGGYYDYWIVKLKKHGEIQWQKCLGGSGYDLAYSIKQTAEGGYIVAGYSGSNDGDVSGNHGITDYWIVKLKKNGDIQWQKCLGGSGDDEANSIQQTADSGFIVAGYSGSHDGDVTGNHGGEYDYWIVKLSKDSSNMPSSNSTTLDVGIRSKNIAQTKINSKDFTVYPNPAKDVLHIQTNSNAVFSLINSSGKIVLTKPVNVSGNITIGALPAGNYYLENNTTGAVQKVVVER